MLPPGHESSWIEEKSLIAKKLKMDALEPNVSRTFTILEGEGHLLLMQYLSLSILNAKYIRILKVTELTFALHILVLVPHHFSCHWSLLGSHHFTMFAGSSTKRPSKPGR
jgi:hypothetical protein